MIAEGAGVRFHRDEIMPKPLQFLVPLIAAVLLTSGCNNNAPPREVNIVDFTHPLEQKSWKPEQVFSTPDLVKLAKSVQNGDKEAIRNALADNVPVDGVGQKGMTPLAWAYMVRNKPAFRYLLEQNADPNIHIGTLTLMCLLARNEEDSEWLELALKHRGDPNIVETSSDLFGKKTPIFGAIESRKKENLDLLIKAGADLNHKELTGNTPAMFAAVMFRFDSVYYLLEAGADPSILQPDGRSLALKMMDHAVEPGEELQAWREKALTLLEQKGIDLEAEAAKIRMNDVRWKWLQRIESRRKNNKTTATTN